MIAILTVDLSFAESSEVRWFKYTIDKKTTSKLTKAREWKLVSFFLHDMIEGAKGLLGGVVVANAGNKTRKDNPTTRDTMTMFQYTCH